MNKVVNLGNLGGFPFTQGTLDFMQANYDSAFKALGNLAGNKVILSGVVVVGSNVSDGWIVLNGEILPFVGGGLTTDVFIEETIVTKTFQDNTTHNAYVTRVAKLGTPGDFPFSDLKRLNTLREMWLPGDLKEVDCNGAYIAANFDGTGLGINERKGWAVCNGQNGTINRGGRVSVGYDAVTVDPADNVWDVVYNTIGAIGGEKKHQLTIPELPAHNHGIKYGNNGSDGTANAQTIRKNSGDTSEGQGTGTNNYAIEDAGGDQAHENRQPFIVTLFIQKL